MSLGTAQSGAELPYLEMFRAVCTEGGVTAAARLLRCSQPAVSYQVRKLEEALGVKLFERTGRRVVLTPQGRRVRDFADQVFTGLARVRRECVEGARLEPLRLGSASGFGRYVLFPALNRLREEHKEHTLDVRLQYDAADVIVEQLEEGEYEAAFVYKRKISSGLAYEVVYREELVLVCSPELEMSVAPALSSVDGIESLPFITYEECDYVFGRWFETCLGEQPRRLASRSHFTELEEVLELCRRGVGVSIVPRDSAGALLGEGELASLTHSSGTRCFNPVFCVVRSGSEPRPLLRRLSELLA